MDAIVFQSICFVLVGAALTVFVVLDGFDLGMGILNPFWTKHKDRQVLAMHSIWPVWDGNEIWGILAAGGLLSAFPPVFGLVLTGFYPYAILLVIAIMYRPIAFEVWFYNEKARKFWQGVFALASFGIAVLIGAIIGNSIWGMKLTADGNYAGNLLELLNPFSLLTGIGFVTVCMLHGALWLRVKMPGETRDELDPAFRRVWFIHAAVTAAWLVFFFAAMPGAFGKPLVVVGAVLLVADLVCIRLAYGKAGEKLLFVLSTLGIAAIWLVISAYQYPMLIQGRDDAGLTGDGLSIGNASSPSPTLQFLGTLAPVILVIVAAYSIYVYRVFKGKVKAGGVGY